MKIPQSKIHDIGVGCLLHDLGLRYITVNYTNRSIEEFSEAELAEYKKHPIYGYSALKDETWISDLSKDIILYHTHTTEGYIDAKDEETELGRTLNANYNVIAIGEKLKQSLENNGFNVTHIKDYHDINRINGAYTRSKETVENKIKEQENKADIIFDIHRDAYMDGEVKENTIDINGEKMAHLRFVIAIGHEGWEENLKWAVELQKRADEMYPGLFKSLYIYDNTYNQSISKYATLIEVGNNANTVEEAKRSIMCFANILKDVIHF